VTLRHRTVTLPRLQTMSNIVGLRSAQALGHAGLLPFFALSFACWWPGSAAVDGVSVAQMARLALVAYAAVILSFLGAVHWGFALLSPQLSRTLLRQSLFWGVVPSLLGWLALLMSFAGIAPWLVFAFLIGDLLLCRLMDASLLPHYPTAPDWYLGLRSRLTAGATLALAVALPASF
jgi:Protein of unknown function (DUF3429)